MKPLASFHVLWCFSYIFWPFLHYYLYFFPLPQLDIQSKHIKSLHFISFVSLTAVITSTCMYMYVYMYQLLFFQTCWHDYPIFCVFCLSFDPLNIHSIHKNTSNFLNNDQIFNPLGLLVLSQFTLFISAVFVYLLIFQHECMCTHKNSQKWIEEIETM